MQCANAAATPKLAQYPRHNSLALRSPYQRPWNATQFVDAHRPQAHVRSRLLLSNTVAPSRKQ